jgi:hypothetical protein
MERQGMFSTVSCNNNTFGEGPPVFDYGNAALITTF